MNDKEYQQMRFQTGSQYHFNVGLLPDCKSFLGDVLTVDGSLLIVRDQLGLTYVIDTISPYFRQASAVEAATATQTIDRKMMTGLGKFIPPADIVQF